MTKKFMIHYCPGTGAYFLKTVFAKLMGIPVNTVISSLGDCHDLGKGVWVAPLGIGVAHGFDNNTTDIKFTYRPGLRLYSTHVLTSDFIEQNPDVEVIKIGAEPADYHSITTIYVKKAWANVWTKEEYDKWASPNYPPYSPNNIAESDLICNDLINDFITTQTTKWFEQSSTLNYAHVIDFKTIMGINNRKLVDEVSKITGGQITNDVCEFINKYQQINKKLYFNRKQHINE